MFGRKLLFAGVLALLFIVPSAVVGIDSQATEGEKKKRELPKSGTLSSSVVGGGSEGVAVDGVWGGVRPFSEDPNPITGSVSRLNKTDWVVRIKNNSEDKYRVTVQVNQFNDRRKKMKSNNYSYSLTAGQQVERQFKARPGVEQCVLELKNWKNLSPPKPEGEGEQGSGKKATS